ncbi:DUF58 domain-containing protein [Gilvimarinus sp. F26214L]|uniref:DUF58 domain-containing protein n=1 Tax=Gilvimarinus sp. DZF01 TaxID=3461371 RepID=UPI004045D545
MKSAVYKPEAGPARSGQDLGAHGAYTDMNALLKLRFAARDLRLAPRRQSRASLSGASRTRFRGRGMEFEEVRVYQPGDDIRSIDWRVTARTHVPHTKLFREERERPTFVAADQRASLFFGSQRCFKSVLCAHLAGLLAWAALHNNDRVGGLVFGNRDHRDVRPRRSKHSALEFVQRLHEYNHKLHSPLIAERQMPLRTVLRDLRRIARPGSALYLISDFDDYDDHCREELYLLSRHTEVALLMVSDPLEQALPAAGLLTVSNGSERMQLAADDASVRDEFHTRYARRFETIRQHSQALRVPLYAFSTAEDEIGQMQQIYRASKGGKRRANRP